MKTILIPTDFSLDSLECIPSLCRQLQGEDLTLVFAHFFNLSDSMQELLMLSRRSKEYMYVRDEFYDRLNEIKASCKGIKNLKIEFFYGSTIGLFRTFLEANQISHVLDQMNCSVEKINKASIEPRKLLLRSGLPVITVQEQFEVQRRMEELTYDEF